MLSVNGKFPFLFFFLGDYKQFLKCTTSEYLMEFQDLCWVEAIFEKMMEAAQGVKTKKEVIAIIKNEHDFIKDQRLSVAEEMKRNC